MVDLPSQSMKTREDSLKHRNGENYSIKTTVLRIKKAHIPVLRVKTTPERRNAESLKSSLNPQDLTRAHVATRSRASFCVLGFAEGSKSGGESAKMARKPP